MHFKRILRIAFSTVVLAGVASAAQTAPRPNILYLYADDLGWSSFNANAGSETLTEPPTIDSQATSGINFRRGYGYRVCSPAHSSQQTGFHQGPTWTDRNDPDSSKAMREDDQAVFVGERLGTMQALRLSTSMAP